MIRLIAHRNIGGVAIQAITMTRLLEARGYRTRPVCGREGAEQISIEWYLAGRSPRQPRGRRIGRLRRDREMAPEITGAPVSLG